MYVCLLDVAFGIEGFVLDAGGECQGKEEERQGEEFVHYIYYGVWVYVIGGVAEQITRLMIYLFR